MVDPALFGHGDFVTVRAELIREVGAVEAIVLSRIHFRATEAYRHAYQRDGEWWWRAPADVISEETGLSEKQVRRAITALRDAGHIVAEQHQLDSRYDRALSYRVALASASEGRSEVPQRADVDPPSGADVRTTQDAQPEERKTPPTPPARRPIPPKPLPEDWEPSDSHRAFAAERHLDLDYEVMQFRAHAEANDRWQASWNGAFTTWLGKARPRPTPLPGMGYQPERKLSVREQNVIHVLDMERREAAERGIER